MYLKANEGFDRLVSNQYTQFKPYNFIYLNMHFNKTFSYIYSILYSVNLIDLITL